MEFWLSIAIGYCIISWILVFLVTRTHCYAAALEADNCSRDRSMFFEWGLVLCAPIYLPLLAIFLAYSVINALFEIRTLNRSLRTFRAYEFVKADVLDLDESIREQFEKFTPPLLQLDFDLIGDYRLKPEPVEVHDRFLLSENGETLAAVCAVLEAGDVCFISVLEDGTCVDTTGSEDPHPDRVFDAVDQLWVSYLPDTPVQEIYLHHLQTLKDLCARHSTRVLRFQREKFRAIVTYDQRIHCRWRYRYGGMDQEPPAPDFASLLETPLETSEAAKHVSAS